MLLNITCDDSVDVYYANGGVISCDFGKISKYYGLTYSKDAVNTYTNETAKRQKIADVLASGKYPAGVLVIGRTHGTNHMVVARRVSNGTIYCDDPVRGKNLPISDTWRVSENIISYWMFTPTSKWNSSGADNSSASTTTTNAPSVETTESGKWYVDVPANHKLLLYSDAVSTTSTTYVSARNSAYSVVCTQKAILANGTIRYYGSFNENDHYWLTYSDSMNVEDRNETGNQSELTVSSIEYGNWCITLPPNSSEPIYDNAAATDICGSYGYPTIDCIQKATLSDGTVRYCAELTSNGGKFFCWITLTSSMSVEDRNTNQLPTNLTITTNKDAYTLGERVTIAPSADNAAYYAVTVWFSAFDTGELVCSDSKFYSNITFTPPRAGTYAIRVDAINDAGYISTEKTFTVTDPGNSGSDDYQKRTWGEWSDWSASYATPSDTRQVETREVKISDAHSEFRYGRYIDSTGSHGCWCAKYLESRSYTSGSAVLQYSDWTSTQYYANRTGWTCGYCHGNHIGVHHVGSDGRAWWAEFELPSGSYYWEETR